MKHKFLLLIWLSIVMSSSGYAQLIKAIEKGDNAKISSLISGKPELVNAEKEESYGDYAIHLAALKHNHALLTKLISANADINLQNGRSNTAFHIAVAEQDAKAIEILEAENPDFNLKNFNGNDILLLACKNNQAVLINRAMEKDENINDQNAEGYSALMYATMHDDKKTADALLKSGANVSLKTKDGKTTFDFVKSEEMRWLVGTEDYLSDYVEDVNTLQKYHSKFPDSKNLAPLAGEILNNASQYSEVEQIDKLKILPDADIEKRSVELVTDYYEAKKFKNRFPASTNNKQVVLNAMQESSSSGILGLKNLFGAEFELDSLDFTKLNANDYKRSKFLNAQFVLNPALTLDDIDRMFTEYSWLKFDDKTNIIMENYWNISVGALDFGNVVLEIMRSLPSKPEFEITDADVENFIQGKFKDEVRKNVRVASVNYLGTENPEWDLWCKNDEYTAGLVKDEGDIRYIVYGELQNNSIFDLPVKVDGSGDLYEHKEMRASGILGGIVMIGAVLSGARTSSDRKLATVENTYYIPAVTANDKGLYAVVLDFGEGVRRQGINFFDQLKVSTEIKLRNSDAECSYTNHTLTQDEMARQDQWQDLAENGMPHAKLYDMWRGTEVVDAEWREKKRKIDEERARAAAEYNRMQNEAYRSVQIVSGEKDSDFNLYKYSDNSSTLSVTITDGGMFSSNVCEDFYTASLSAGYDSETSDDPFSDSFDTWQLPARVSITYKPSESCTGETKTVSLVFTEPGSYDISIF